MAGHPKSKGPWLNRMAIHLFTLILGVLFFWLLGFLVDDLRNIPAPRYEEVEARHLDKGLVAQRDAQDKQIADLNRQIENQQQQQGLVGDASQSLRQTITQLLEMQKIAVQQNAPFSEADKANIASSLTLFLEHQQKYQDMNRAVTDSVQRKQALTEDRRQIEERLEVQRRAAQEEHNRNMERHRIRLALLQLAVLVPLLSIASVLLMKKRGSVYFPLLLAFGVATLFKVTEVVHEYFPMRYVRYVFIAALILVVARMLVYFIRTIAFPKAQWLAKQYREAYERFLCPVCEYPIRIGPRRYLFWTRRTVNKVVIPHTQVEEEQPYTCPSCGTALFEECAACHKVRHALLPTCTHCGAEKAQ